MIAFYILFLISLIVVTVSFSSEYLYYRQIPNRWFAWYSLLIIFLLTDSFLFSLLELSTLVGIDSSRINEMLLFYIERVDQLGLEIIFVFFIYNLLGRKIPKWIPAILVSVIILYIALDIFDKYAEAGNRNQQDFLSEFISAVGLVHHLLYYFYCIWLIVFRSDMGNKSDGKAFSVYIVLSIVFYSGGYFFNIGEPFPSLNNLGRILELLVYPVFCISWFLYRFWVNFFMLKKLMMSNPQIDLEDIAKEYQLTDRQYEVLDLLLKGKTSKDIADILFLSERTVQNHIYKIYKIFHVSSRMILFDKLVRISATLK